MTQWFQNNCHDCQIDTRFCFGYEGHCFFQTFPSELMPRCVSNKCFHLTWCVRVQRYLNATERHRHQSSQQISNPQHRQNSVQAWASFGPFAPIWDIRQRHKHEVNRGNYNFFDCDILVALATFRGEAEVLQRVAAWITVDHCKESSHAFDKCPHGP